LVTITTTSFSGFKILSLPCAIYFYCSNYQHPYQHVTDDELIVLLSTSKGQSCSVFYKNITILKTSVSYDFVFINDLHMSTLVDYPWHLLICKV